MAWGACVAGALSQRRHPAPLLLPLLRDWQSEPVRSGQGISKEILNPSGSVADQAAHHVTADADVTDHFFVGRA
jgi:hypothetical protein